MIHFHSWEPWGEPTTAVKRIFPSKLERLQNPAAQPWDVPTEWQRRRCRKCGEVQDREVRTEIA